KPFLQISGLKSASKGKKSSKDNTFELEEGSLISTAKLDFALASGNNSTLFDHEALNSNRSAKPEKLALDLLTYQMFSPGGLIGSVIWSGKTTDRTSSDAPCVPGSMLHTFVRGENLLGTIHLNILAEDELSIYKALV
ncbi:MAG: type I-E CRISPR-associated protein Cse1/CasA, partial [Desulfovibrio sp.]|nr:type I-E CRISPR-associated protein Cse1/CasA [Desulfovibrio sp.]